MSSRPSLVLAPSTPSVRFALTVDLLAQALRATLRLNRAGDLNGRPFSNAIPMVPLVGERWFSWVHYGVMVPGLPEPHRFFNVMAILGTTGAVCFDNDPAIRTTARDTAYVISTTSATPERAFRSYSLTQECELSADGSRLRFGEDLVIEGSYPRYQLHRDLGTVTVDLELELTDKVAYFVRAPRVYDHWSLLARCHGAIRDRDGAVEIEGLGTFEYARGAGLYSLAGVRPPRWLKVPVTRFTYQVLNVDATSQLLLTEVGRRGGIAMRGAYERGLEDYGGMRPRAEMTITQRRTQPAITPDGREMQLPARWTWNVSEGRDAVSSIVLECVASDDWIHGLGAGYAGSFTYSGAYRDTAVDGVGYVEYIDA
jgi:hypothetical protein